MPPHAVKPESRLDRAKKQRMYFMGRVADAEEGSAQFLVSGSSGKVYTVSVPQTSEERAVPAAGYGGRGTAKFKCNCMDHIMRRRACKHMLFLCLRVLKMSDEELTALESSNKVVHPDRLRTALDEIPPGSDDAAGNFSAPAHLKAQLKAAVGDYEGGTTKKVEPRPVEDGDTCPICCEDLVDDSTLTRCKYGCGKPLHVECWNRYAASRASSQGDPDLPKQLVCVFCRTPWDIKEGSGYGRRGVLNSGRLVNLGIDYPEDFPNAVKDVKKGRSKKGGKAGLKGKIAKGASGKAASSKKGASVAVSMGAGPSSRTSGAGPSSRAGTGQAGDCGEDNDAAMIATDAPPKSNGARNTRASVALLRARERAARKLADKESSKKRFRS